MKVREFELDNVHIEFYDDCFVSKEHSDELYKQLGRYIRYVKHDIKKGDNSSYIKVSDM